MLYPESNDLAKMSRLTGRGPVCGYPIHTHPIYGFPWIEVEDGVYAWDGSLLSNTPIREVIYSSPRNDKMSLRNVNNNQD